MSSFGQRFGLLLRRKRAENGLTQAELAHRAFGNPDRKSTISGIENGRTNPQAKTVEILASVLGISQEELDASFSTQSVSEPPTKAGQDTASVFISYSWESDAHRRWVIGLAARLRRDGVDAKLDHWHAAPGDQLTEFMEREIRANDFVIIVCTPTYKQKSNSRLGGVGYEGDIMTADALTSKNHRKFIPILALGRWQESAPDWLRGKYRINLSNNEFFEQGYHDLITTLHGERPKPPPIGTKPVFSKNNGESGKAGNKTLNAKFDVRVRESEPVKILGVVVDQVSEPTLDGSARSALYRIPFKLSRKPSRIWSEHFVRTWNSPPKWTSMHRPGIASVSGDQIVLDGTTIEEVERTHRETLILCVNEANIAEAKYIDAKILEDKEKQERSKAHSESLSEASKRLKF